MPKGVAVPVPKEGAGLLIAGAGHVPPTAMLLNVHCVIVSANPTAVIDIATTAAKAALFKGPIFMLLSFKVRKT
jgi:hypothetical protein